MVGIMGDVRGAERYEVDYSNTRGASQLFLRDIIFLFVFEVNFFLLIEINGFHYKSEYKYIARIYPANYSRTNMWAPY